MNKCVSGDMIACRLVSDIALVIVMFPYLILVIFIMLPYLILATVL